MNKKRLDLLKFRRFVYKFVYKFRDIPVFSGFIAERQALEPVLSQNIMQSQMSINNQLITIIIKSKYY